MTTARNKRAKIAAYNRRKNTPPKETRSPNEWLGKKLTGKEQVNPEWADQWLEPAAYKRRKEAGAYTKTRRRK